MSTPLPTAPSITIGTSTNPVAPETVTVTVPPTPRTFTAEDMERARAEEKEKLFKRLAAADEKVLAVETEIQRLARESAEEKAAKEMAKAAKASEKEERARAQAEAEMSARALLETRTKEFDKRFADLEAERALERAALAKEAEFARLRAYIQESVNRERGAIAPELLDLISGDTREEIDASIATLKAKTEAILSSVQQAQVTARSQMRGTAPTGFTGQGPLDNEGNQRQLTQEDIAKMPMKEYARLRGQLLGAAANSVNRGIFD